MTQNPNHILAQPDTRPNEWPSSFETNHSSLAESSLVHQQYLFELTLPSSEQILIKCSASPFYVGSDTTKCSLVLTEIGIEPVHIEIRCINMDQVMIRNLSSQAMQYIAARIYVNGKVHGENQPRVGFKKRRFNNDVNKPAADRVVELSEPEASEIEQHEVKGALPAGMEHEWLVGATLLFQNHVLTLYKTAQYSKSGADYSFEGSLFNRVEGRVLPSVQLRNRQFAGIHMRQIFGAWWVFALLFLGGGLSFYSLPRILRMISTIFGPL